MAQAFFKGVTLSTASALALAAAGQASAVKLTAGDTEINIYGYTRLNASYDIDEDIALSTRSGSFGAVNTGDAEDNEVTGHFGADAYQSRVGISVKHDTGARLDVQGDFRGSGGGSFRLREAYGEYRGILAGQTWSNYNSFVGYTSVLDFDALAGSPGIQGRTTQLRYTQGSFSVSLEEAESFGGVINDAGAQKTSLPALTARYESSVGPVAVSLAGLVKQVEVDNGGDVDDSTGSAVVFAAATFNVTDALSVQGAINYSNGANSYLYRSGEDFGAADAYFHDGSLETITGYGGTVGLSYRAGQGTFNLGYGMVTNDWDDAEDDLGAAAVADRHETNSNVLVNYQWRPVEHVMYGVEYGYFQVEEVDGDDGDASRVMFAGQYNF